MAGRNRPHPSPLSTFSTDKGSISPSTVTTDANGNATATLTTTATANITATAGTQTGKAIVTVNARGLSSFTANPASTTTGVPVTFTVTPTTGANLSSVRVDFGDGFSSGELGSIGGATSVPHAYGSSGTFTATATAKDASGDAGSLSTQVIISALQVTLTATPNPGTVGSPVTFTVSGVGSAAVDHYQWTWDDGTLTFATGSPQTSHTFTSKGIKNIRVDVFGISGTKIGTASLQMDVQ